jgi:hypothetical protein
MSGQAVKNKRAFLPAPIDGVNLVAPPSLLQDTEARQLDNYYIYDWGIRERRSASNFTAFTFPGTVYAAIPIKSDPHVSNLESCLVVSGGFLYWVDSAGWVAPTNKGAITVSGECNWTIFNKYVFIFTSASAGGKYNITAGTLGAMGFTGPAGNLVQGSPYKSRLYAVENNTTLVWYGAVGGIAGALTSFDVSQVLSDNSNISFVTGWTYNQGLSNDELFVIVSESGEILVYSGDYPGATNWVLAGRTRIPKPNGRSAWYKLGQEIYIRTSRGVVPLHQVFTGAAADINYYSVSRNLGQYLGNSTDQIAFDNVDPFLYFMDGVTTQNLYVLNYERGAWSRFTFGFTIEKPVFVFGILYFFDSTTHNVWRNSDPYNPGSDPSYEFIAKTKYFDFGSTNQKTLNMVRAMVRLGANGSGSTPSTLEVTGAIAADYSDADVTANENQRFTESNTVTVSTYDPNFPSDISVVEFAPCATGTRFSLWLQQLVNQDVQKEILGYEFIWSEGGLY